METGAIEGLQFWLRPLHASNGDDLAPPPHEAISDVISIPDRLASLTNVASVCAQRFQSGTSSLMKLHVVNRGLCARRASGSVVHHLPLELSQVAACPHTALGSVSPTSHVVGIIAYAPPVGFPGILDPGLVAIIVVSRLENASNMWPAGTSSALLDRAMAMLAFKGAICRRLGGCMVSAKVLGMGGFGSVRLCHTKSIAARLPQYSHCQTSVAGVRELAAKSWGPSTSQEIVLDELSNLLAAQGHPNVCMYIAATCDASSASSPVWMLIMEAYPRGNVFDIIRTDKNPFEEEYALLLTKDILGGLNHIHGKLIIHRDIKPANICLDVDGRAVIIDFGCAVHTSRARMATPCGTPGSIAPEVLARMPYGPKVDVFACATVLYYALGGILPFTGDCTLATLSKNKRAHVRFPTKHFGGVQPCTRKILKVMMRVLAEERPTSFEAFRYVSKVSMYIQDAKKAMPLPCAAESNSGVIESVAVFDEIVCTGGGGGFDGGAADDVNPTVDPMRASKLVRPCTDTSRRTGRSGRLRRAMASFLDIIAHRVHHSTSKDASLDASATYK